MKSNTLTIIKKEFARVFGDRQLVFTTIIMPGLLIYLIYSLMGNGIEKMMTDGANEVVTLHVENMESVPPSLAQMIDSLPATAVVRQSFDTSDISTLNDKDLNVVLVRFPDNFDLQMRIYDPQGGTPAPNVEIYYNSTNNASSRVFTSLFKILTAFEDQMSNRFDVNREDEGQPKFDQATDESKGAMVWSKLLPMLIIMMLFSGVMAIAPSAIAGEKERGTIATLLVTPMRRNELALGKIVSLSCIALLSGVSSFIGIALSLPNMVGGEESAALTFHYTFGDYIVLLLIIFASVLIMASAVSLLSALAKDVKNAGTMVTPFMLVVMLAGLMPMFQNGTSENIIVYLIPFYNSIEVMTATFAHEMRWMPVAVTLASNLAYTGVAVWGLTRMFNSEKVMFSK